MEVIDKVYKVRTVLGGIHYAMPFDSYLCCVVGGLIAGNASQVLRAFVLSMLVVVGGGGVVVV